MAERTQAAAVRALDADERIRCWVFKEHSAPDTFGVRDLANDPWRTAWASRASLGLAATD